MTRPIRVLVVDDSAFARKVLRELLAAEPDIEVVDTAHDGLEALEKAARLHPDVMTLDLVMPNLDGVGVLEALPRDGSAPRVVVVSIADEASALGIRALQAGAVELVPKSTTLGTNRFYEIRGELVAKVRAAAIARAPSPSGLPARRPVVLPETIDRRLVLIGASTGGPRALATVLEQLPAEFPVPIVAVLHMPSGYTAAYAERLDDDCAIDVVEASDRLLLRPGLAVIGRGGIHAKIHSRNGGFEVRLDVHPLGALHRPSVDTLFESAVAESRMIVAVVLTGMGQDGARGAKALAARGAAILTEAESSCVVYGMPRAVKEAGVRPQEAAIGDMAALIARTVGRG